MEHPSLELHTFPQPRLLTLIHHFLSSLGRYPREPRNLLCSCQAPLDTFFRTLKALRSQPPLLRLAPIDHPPRKYHVHSLTLPDRPRQPLRSPRTWYRPQRDLRLPKHSPGRTVDNVRHHRQLASPAQRIPVHRRQQRLLHRTRLRRPRRDEVLAVSLPERQVAHFGDVRARGEGLLIPGEDDGADFVAGVEGAEGRVEFGEDGGGECVQLFGTVERDWDGVS